ncbi:MAG: molybdate ABC transporter substrate-binding protein [Planctomycetaceae bacterium]
MSRTPIVMLTSLVALVAMFWLLSSDNPNGGRPTLPTSSDAADTEIMMYCAASNRSVVEAIRTRYEQETGRRVSIQYGPSQTLLSQLQVARTGDLYLPADDSFLELAAAEELVEEVLPLAAMNCVIVVAKGNPHGIDSLDDLFAEDLRVVQANPDAAAVARVTRKLLTESGQWDQLDASTEAYRTTVNDVANDVLVGAADAGIVYDAVLYPYPDLEAIRVPELAAGRSQISVGVTSFSEQPAAALHFARYLSAKDRGLEEYRRQGFETSTGDAWQDTPELTVYAGSMLRPAIEETIQQFETREGVLVSRTYNGCGILVAQMQAGQHPDAYFACDVEFMTQVGHLFPDPMTVSTNQLVILVPKGNPRQLASLRDLAQPDLRVGIGHEKQCAMGWLTQQTLDESGMKTEIMANVTVQTPTGDMLVNQLRTGSLDAAVAYLSNAAGSGEFLDAVQIQGIPCSTATQPWAVAEESRFPQLANRLFRSICSAESQEIFSAEGFGWQLQPFAVKESGL